MKPIKKAFETYREEVVELANSSTTTEESYYGPIRDLLIATLKHLELPTDVRTGTSESRTGGGSDRPDVALYDAEGDFAVVCGEIKLPEPSLKEMAKSTDRNDQIGRYLAQTGVILLSNVRGFGLLVPGGDWDGGGPVPPSHRHLLTTVTLWPTAQSLREGGDGESRAPTAFTELVEEAVTSFAPIADPETLARVLALQARRAKEELPKRFTDAVQSLADDFGEALGITFEGKEGESFFRSSLVQTVFYGLFAGWLLWTQEDSEDSFRWQKIPDYLSIPFLGELFYELQHPQRIDELGLAPRLDVATETLGRVDRERFFDKLAIPSMQDESADPERAAASAIIYFYEPFLAAFDPELRKELGVWYTPPEIVRYQVSRVDELLRNELDCDRGLADDRVVVLDPACGTGAYLIEVLTRITRQLRSEGVEAELGAELLKAIQKRVLGFEILTAPFVIAHLQIHLILAGLGAAPGNDERPGIYLTNALTGWGDEEPPKLHFPELSDEHDLAHQVKQDVPIIVVLGNPPYNRFAGAPIEEERDLADHYKGITRDAEGRQQGATELYSRFGIRKHLLDDLYIRFYRMAERQIGEQAKHGIVTYISNNSYLAGRSHPLMRESLLSTFHSLWIDNLHGNRLASERTPKGDPCETVFKMPTGSPGIRVGTAINTLVKREEEPKPPEETPIHIRDFWGKAEAKRQALIDSLSMASWAKEEKEKTVADPAGPRPYEIFHASQRQRWKLVPYEATGGYEDWYALDELFPASLQGINPNRGLSGSVIAMQRDELHERMEDYFSDDQTFQQVKGKYPELCKSRARYEHPKATRQALMTRGGFDEERIVPYILFPLDKRFLYYETNEKLLNEARPDLKGNLEEENAFLLAVPQPRRVSESIPLFATSAFDLHAHDRGAVGLPARLIHEPPQPELFDHAPEVPRANLDPKFWEGVSDAWGLTGDLAGAEAQEFAMQLLRVCLAIGHAPQYQDDHRGILSQEWARIPVPKLRNLFEETANVGNALATLLDPTQHARSVMEDILGAELLRQLARVTTTDGEPVRANDLTVEISYFGSATGRWEERDWSSESPASPGLGDTTGDLYLNDRVYLSNVPQKVWEMELGGYPVVSKWLGYRQASRRDDEPLTLDEKDTLRELIQRLAAIAALHPALDDLYDRAAANAWTAVPEAEQVGG